jgi:hypothetical protein
MSIVTFLFHLQGLSIVFVALMVGVFGVGFIYSRATLARFENECNDLASKYPGSVYAARLRPEEYLRMHLDDSHSAASLAAIPGYLVSLGILGTFIGLGIAVGEAATAMSGDPQSAEAMQAMQTALNGLMGAISFKFQSSAWGILSSLVFSLTVEARFHKKVESIVEVTSRKILAGYQTVGGQLDASLMRMGAELRAALEASIRQMAEQNAQPIAQLSGRIAQLEASLATIQAAAQQMKKAAVDLGQLSGKIDDSLAKVASVINGQLEAGNKQTRAALTDIEGRLADAGKQHAASAERQTNELRSSLSAMEGSIQRSSATQAAAADRMSRDVDSAIQKMRSEVAAMMKESNIIQESSRVIMQDTRNAISSMDGTVENVGRTIDAAATVNRRMADVFEEMASVLAGLKMARASDPRPSRSFESPGTAQPRPDLSKGQARSASDLSTAVSADDEL